MELPLIGNFKIAESLALLSKVANKHSRAVDDLHYLHLFPPRCCNNYSLYTEGYREYMIHLGKLHESFSFCLASQLSWSPCLV